MQFDVLIKNYAQVIKICSFPKIIFKRYICGGKINFRNGFAMKCFNVSLYFISLISCEIVIWDKDDSITEHDLDGLVNGCHVYIYLGLAKVPMKKVIDVAGISVESIFIYI